MKQMDINEQQKVSFDFSTPELPDYVKEFQPLLYKDGDKYCAVLGPDITKGIFGCGRTAMDALLSWHNNLLDALPQADPNDEVMQFVIDTINTKKKDVW